MVARVFTKHYAMSLYIITILFVVFCLLSIFVSVYVPFRGFLSVGTAGPVICFSFSPDKLLASDVSFGRATYLHAWQYAWPRLHVTWRNNFRVATVDIPAIWVCVLLTVACFHASYIHRKSELRTTAAAGGTT